MRKAVTTFVRFRYQRHPNKPSEIVIQTFRILLCERRFEGFNPKNLGSRPEQSDSTHYEPFYRQTDPRETEQTPRESFAMNQ